MDMPEESFTDLQNLCPPNYYRIVYPSELPEPIPYALKEKCSHVVLITSGEVGTSTVWYMANLIRLDKKANAIDQEPFIYIVRDGKFLTSGCLIHHGDWEERTVVLPETVATVTSALLDDTIRNQLPAEVGTIGELSPDNPHVRAFEVAVEKMKEIYQMKTGTL